MKKIVGMSPLVLIVIPVLLLLGCSELLEAWITSPKTGAEVGSSVEVIGYVSDFKANVCVNDVAVPVRQVSKGSKDGRVVTAIDFSGLNEGTYTITQNVTWWVDVSIR